MSLQASMLARTTSAGPPRYAAVSSAAEGRGGREALIALARVRQRHGQPEEQVERGHDPVHPQRGTPHPGRIDGTGGEEDQAEDGVRGEDVARVQQDRVQRAEHEQTEEAAQHPGCEGGTVALGRVHLEGEAVAEEEGEQQVELGLHERHDEPVRQLVQTIGGWPGGAVA
ncbi:hypothetical protein [Streptomyces cyaneofuscatus]|uniref:hypothetical protein n=1 Tax=Streptomyces cyaneofuscatus TaxID=66883 RepID=UPI00365FC0B2